MPEAFKTVNIGVVCIYVRRLAVCQMSVFYQSFTYHSFDSFVEKWKQKVEIHNTVSLEGIVDIISFMGHQLLTIAI